MGLRIATNVQSLVAQRNLGNSHLAQQNSLEKLASGSRINRAADDAAGLAISEKMRANIRSIRQDVRNANDGIGMIQTAEGGMNEIGNILVRLRELSTQAASDTVSDTERSFVDKEVQQLKQEVDRNASSTEFNGVKLLNGQGPDIEVQVGLHNNPEQDRFKIEVGKLNVTSDALGISGVHTRDKSTSQENLDKLDAAIKTLSENRSTIGALQNRFQSSITSLNVYQENLSAARSRISDVDIADETAELTKQNILASTGVSVLSQANQNNMSALKLI
jgi:flagellin